MSFKPFARALAAALVLAATAAVASAQVTQVTGKVTLKQADGTTVPVAGAAVDIYRTDIKQEFHIKTDKKGQYLHAGLPFVGTYTIIVSAPGAKPTFAAGLRFTQVQTRDFVLDPGDGSKLTLDQVKALGSAPAANSGGGGSAPAESKEAKAAREELERKNAEIVKKNEEITKSNESVSNAFKAGNDALNANHLDEAITAYQTGLAARGDEPALLTNLSEALRRRGVNRYNEALKMSDKDAQAQAITTAKKDWTDAADAAKKALDTINAALAGGADAQQAQVYGQNKIAALSTRALAMRLVATKVDNTQGQAAWDAYQEYLKVETDPAKKAKMKGEALQTLFDAGAVDLAVEQARAAVAEDPDNVDANRILGLALFASGDKAKFQEAANYLQRYVDKAPDTDPLKASAKESLDYLKTAENVKPEKVTPSRPSRSKRP
ncbi:MAG TPA: carboxypeptidase regulatory-like domain-containing protein [Pyrinomonadaceae bacterium]|nr:carboxypeptidase regulatory-like domain-containing protein [Pyrinomonadaceae bacterium]